MMRRNAGSFLGGRSRWLLAIAIVAPMLLLSGPPVRALQSPMRYQNFHASACESADSSLFHAVYSNAGMTVSPITIPPNPPPTSSMVTCPLTWSLDVTNQALAEIYVSVSWSGVPTSGPSGPITFDPGCTVTLNTKSSIFGGSISVLYDHTDGGGTSTPTMFYIWKSPDPTMGPYLYGNVIGSVLSCISVPPGVVLNGYAATTCIANATSSCSF